VIRERILGMNLANLLCAFTGRHNDPANGDDEADNDFPSIDELLAFQSKGISVGTTRSQYSVFPKIT
jgi:hypothetical protein